MFFVGIKEVIVNFCDDIIQWDKRVVVFGVDGVSVNFGKKGGVAVLMRKDILYFEDFYCLLYRFEFVFFEM